MNGQPNPSTPGTGLLSTNGEPAVPVEVPYLDDAAVALIWRNVLFGGEPGSGKSVWFDRSAMREALSAPAADGWTVTVCDPKEGERRGADPGR